MELYIIRHGDPNYAKDTLTETGREQAKKLAKRMEQIKPDKIYVSPLGRAKETAAPTCKLLNMEYKIEEWTAESMVYMHSPNIKRGKLPNKGWTTSLAHGVRHFEDFADTNRTRALEELEVCSDHFIAQHGYVKRGLFYRAKKPNDEKIAVFCHGGFGAAWISHLLSLPPAMGWMQFVLSTASITKFLFENDDSGYTIARCIYLNDISHLFLT